MASLPDRVAAGALELRRWSLDRLDDAVRSVEASYPELHQWMDWALSLPTRESLQRFIEDSIASFEADREWQYCLVDGEDGELVGAAGLHRRGEPNELEIGYWVRTDRCGRGYATASARSLTTAAFGSSLDLETVVICMDKANVASAAVPRKLGFRLDREVEQDIVTPGHTGRKLIWSMERSRWLDGP